MPGARVEVQPAAEELDAKTGAPNAEKLNLHCLGLVSTMWPRAGVVISGMNR